MLDKWMVDQSAAEKVAQRAGQKVLKKGMRRGVEMAVKLGRRWDAQLAYEKDDKKADYLGTHSVGCRVER